MGVLEDGSTYTGPYNSSIYGSTDFKIGPGVAPQAQLYIYRVFGCEGSSDVVTEAINQAVKDGADVISMSLGSDFGTSDTPDAVAADNASRAGVVVVAASGNEGTSAYMTSTPASSSRAISVAAVDSNATFPGATISVGSIAALDANNGPLPVTGTLDVLGAPGAISLGCDDSDYTANGGVAGKIVVTERGSCARVLRAQLGQEYGAAAVIMVNTSAGLPPFEGPIPGVTIPFIGVEAADGAALEAANGDTVTISSAGMLANPTYKDLASFSSWGPRFGDSALKPEVTAPGVSIVAAGMGTGNDVLVDSGTSMATPHVAGVAALVIAAHPDWSVNEVKAAIMSTADDSSAKILGYDPLGAGSGVVQAQLATTTAAVALTRDKLDTLSFDNVALGGPYSADPDLHDREQELQLDHVQTVRSLHRQPGRGSRLGLAVEDHRSRPPVAGRRHQADPLRLGGRGAAPGRHLRGRGSRRRPDGRGRRERDSNDRSGGRLPAARAVPGGAARRLERRRRAARAVQAQRRRGHDEASS